MSVLGLFLEVIYKSKVFILPEPGHFTSPWLCHWKPL